MLLLTCLFLPFATAATVRVGFNPGFSDSMVLQRAPAKAAVYGYATAGTSVTLKIQGGAYTYILATTATADGAWRVYLHPTPPGGSYTATLTGGATPIVLTDLTFGDVYLCSGQSNMALMTVFSFSADTIRDDVQKHGKYDNVRIFQYGGMQANESLLGFDNRFVTTIGGIAEDPYSFRWFNLTQSMRNVTYPSGPDSRDADQTPTGKFASKPPFDEFSATCMYFGLELSNARAAAGVADVPIGLIQSAVGGSIIEAWISNSSLSTCSDQFPAPKPGKPYALQHIPGALYYGMISPFVNMTISGWTWYQGEVGESLLFLLSACTREVNQRYSSSTNGTI